MVQINNKGKGYIKESFRLSHLLRKRLGVHLKFHPKFKATPIDYLSIAKMFPVKDQGTSSSCGGQAWASALEVAKYLRDGTIVPLSPKDIYSHCFIKGGGSRESDLVYWTENNGVDTEADVPSGAQDETFYETIAPRNEDNALQNLVINSFTFDGNDIDSVKQAIDTGVAVCALLGNNACWTTSNGIVEVPAQGTTDWGHWIHLCKYDDTTKLVTIKNSWGTEAGDQGYFYIPYEYFSNGNVDGEWVLILGDKDEYVGLLQKIINLLTNIIKLK